MGCGRAITNSTCDSGRTIPPVWAGVGARESAAAGVDEPPAELVEFFELRIFVRAVEHHLACEKLTKDAAGAPHVNRHPIRFLAEEQLGWAVVERDHRVCVIFALDPRARKPEVTDLLAVEWFSQDAAQCSRNSSEEYV